jgi:hypothetical protein
MAQEPTATVTENIPSLQGRVSGVASAQAPFVFIDEFPNSGYYNGIVHITCEALRFMAIDGVPTNDRVIVAHLRMNLPALEALKGAIANVEKMIARPGAQMPPPHKPPS